MPNVEGHGRDSRSTQRWARRRSERWRKHERGDADRRRERLSTIFRVRRCSVRQVFERKARGALVTVRNGRAGQTMWALLATVVGRRGRATVVHDPMLQCFRAGVRFMRTVRVRRMTLVRRIDVLVHGRGFGRQTCRHTTRRNAGRQIGDSERTDEIARRAGVPAP